MTSEAAANLYHGFMLLIIALTLMAICLRFATLDNITYLAIPTVVIIAPMIIFILMPYKMEIALYYADAEIDHFNN